MSRPTCAVTTLMVLVGITVWAITSLFPTLPSPYSVIGDSKRNVTASNASFLPQTQQQHTQQPLTTSLPQDNDNRRIPGPIMNDKLHILGIRLTTSYEKLDESVFVDMFGHAVGEGSNVAFHVVKMDPQNQLTYQEATKPILFAKVHVDNNTIPATREGTNSSSSMAADRVQMEYIPNSSVDGNTLGIHLIWRANVSAFLSRSQLLSRSHLRISIYTNHENPYHSNAATPILIVDIPTDTAALGHAGPMVKQTKRSFLQQAHDRPSGVVLCVAGVDKGGLWYLPEFIQHHLNVGIQHMFFGVNGGETELVFLKEQLSYYIELGVVVLGGESTVMANRQVRKLRFYNQCLFHAKGMAEYVVNWDVDELWMPPLQTNSSDNHLGPGQLTIEQHKDDSVWTNSPYRNSLSLLEAIRMVRGANDCTDWCYQSIPSYTIQRIEKEQVNATHPQYQGYFGFTRRAKEPNYQWQKPIIRTKHAFQASFHLGGSCMIPTPTTQQEGKHVYSPFNKKCPPYKQNVTLGSMHHYYWLFRPEHGLKEAEKFPDLDEYTQQLRSTTLAQLVQLQKEGKINATVTKYVGHGSKIDAP